MEEPQGDHLTGPEVGLGVLGHGAQVLINVAEQRGDKLQGAHELLHAWQSVTLLPSVEEVHEHGKETIHMLVCERLTPSVMQAGMSPG